MVKIKSKIGWTVVIILSLSPLVSWYFALQPFEARIGNSYAVWTSLGQIAGLVGFTMYAIDLVLNTRLKFLEDYFGGMNRVYIAHHTLGGISFMLLLMHPLLLAASFLTYSSEEAALLFLPGDDWARNLGITALSLMMALLLLTFYRNLPYQIWRFLHTLMGVVFLIGILHSFFIASDISREPFMMYHMLFFAVLGVGAYTYRTLLGRFFVKRSFYSLVVVKQLNKNTVEIILKPLKNPFVYKPGQFVFVKFKNAGINEEVHPFSISSASTEQQLVLTVKAEGDYTKNLVNLMAGATAVMEGSFGRFTYTNYANTQQIWIAGGIGITPFVSMAKELVSTPQYKVDLYYSVHDQEEAVYLSDLQKIAAANANFRVIPVISTIQGRLTVDTIEKGSGRLDDKDFFLCGPPPMMHSLRGQLRKRKVKSKNIHSEEFQL